MTTPYVQASLDELDEPLRCTTFTVVDLETTGGSSSADAITEIGAVRVRSGVIEGEFQTLVDPQRAITPFITVLTGITDRMVSSAPTIAATLPAFLEFARGSVLVAHNAPFDIGFLRAACTARAVAWPGFAVIDTAVLARRVLTRDEVPNCKLATLAGFFGATTTPNHRALADARATVDVLHALIGRLGTLGVQSLPELRAFNAQVSDAQRRKRHLADSAPEAPGVYIFRDQQGDPLYVGKSRNLRSRVRNYFVASETRSRMGEMVGLAERVDSIVCAHDLEASVREIRLIAAHKPRYNRRSKFPERAVWLTLTTEVFPRLSIVRKAPAASTTATTRANPAADPSTVAPGRRRADLGGAVGVRYLGPLRSRRQAEQVREAIYEAVSIRQCTARLPAVGTAGSACALAEMGRCLAPCDGSTSATEYDVLVRLLEAAFAGNVRTLVAPLQAKLVALSATQRYEQAAVVRDRVATVVRACARVQRLRALTGIAELVAARPADDTVLTASRNDWPHSSAQRGPRPGGPAGGAWECVVIRRGLLASAGTARNAENVPSVVEALVATAQTLTEHTTVLPEESELLARWLERPGVRLIHVSEPWLMPAFGAGGMRSWLVGESARSAVDPFRDRRALPMTSRPVRASA